PHPFGHQPLKLARLPIPPLRHSSCAQERVSSIAVGVLSPATGTERSKADRRWCVEPQQLWVHAPTLVHRESGIGGRTSVGAQRRHYPRVAAQRPQEAHRKGARAVTYETVMRSVAKVPSGRRTSPCT